MKDISGIPLEKLVGQEIEAFSLAQNQLSIFCDKSTYITCLNYEDFFAQNFELHDNQIDKILKYIIGQTINVAIFVNCDLVLKLQNSKNIVFPCGNLPYESYIIYIDGMVFPV
jgi:hypothetical protein